MISIEIFELNIMNITFVKRIEKSQCVCICSVTCINQLHNRCSIFVPLKILLSLIWRCHHFKNNLIGESQLSEFVQLLSNCIIYKLYSSHSRFFLHSYRYVTITGGFKFWSTLDTQGHGAVRVLYRATFTATLGIRL